MTGSMAALSLLLLLGSLLTMVQSDTKFASKLFSVLHKTSTVRYVVFSPPSIRSALGLAYLGAEGTTAEELKRALLLEGSDKNDMAQRFAHRLAQEQKQYGDDAQFSYANRIYVAERYRLIQAYQELAGKYFNASAENVNFAESIKIHDEINSWVREQTHKQISFLFRSHKHISSDSAAILTNVVYFKASWLKGFHQFQTKPFGFVSIDGQKHSTYTMFQWEFFRYAELPSLKATALEMPYKGTDIVFLIILPLEVQGLYELEEKLSVLDLNEISSQMRREHVQLQIPKLKLEFDVSLQPVLDQLGIKTMFGPNADFSSLAKGRDIKISDMVHKAYLDLNENGTADASAGAPTSWLLSILLMERPTKPFIVDHPFFFAIKDKQTIFFLGHVTSPY
ncbi:serine protease inhibitor 42Dd [Drosophila persimilis]|uniref:serine protease inhibitor 42Dd n=1 Tax=Drosophila persimilis TaxID=7234 RepID=UPI000F075BE7|nr:serine protease inhibitor 42Dd [Drosophila persimilis]